MATPDDEERALSEWSRTLAQALQILDLEVDHPRIVELAARSSYLSPHAGAISAFMVGYAAGTVTTDGREETSAAVEKAANTALTVIAKDEETREEKGWTGSAQ
ncbi:hypothetical protein FDK12_08095 [Arthrobacter sp. NamB2]|uniref:DUF6457 domain-containing protein n=1 Tax=Arthrobacter sp. NamB2 TaxID=2576035 RepID=UPI0010CA015C|nr:DUF6457 domain-containing protein [Arthrobacter sp. NamB2]TKV28607.1 hypothetical protein FDK12_08095 [Arthrobacter sp. NamB2]